MPSNSKPLTSGGKLTSWNNWAFRIFCLSTIFIIFFSIEAIHSWPTFIKSSSILLVCVLPAGVIILSHGSSWLNTKYVPKEIIWFFLLLMIGLISAFLSEDQWTAFKSIILFMVSGPLIYIVTKYLLESTKNQEAFYWLNSLILIIFCFFGVYEHNFNQSDYDAITLFSRNPLPAGTMLILLSGSSMILLSREPRPALKLILTLSLAISAGLIILSAKKTHLLGLLTIFIIWILYKNPKSLKYLAGIIFLSGLFAYFSPHTLSKYKNIDLNNSITLRAENYFFGLHIIKKNPVFGVGYKSNLTQYLDGYNLKFHDEVSKTQYAAFIKGYKTFDNIIMALLVELGGLFTLVYFGGLIYIIIGCLKKTRAPPQDGAWILILSVLAGFATMSLTFDTLRYPNINWLFHSLLGLTANLTKKISIPNILPKH